MDLTTGGSGFTLEASNKQKGLCDLITSINNVTIEQKMSVTPSPVAILVNDTVSF